MFFWLLPLIGCFKLEKGKKAIFSLEQFNPSLYFDRMHIIAGDRVSVATFSRVGDKMYDIKFDGVSMCPKFPRLKIAGCNVGKWEVRPVGPYFKIATINSKGEEYCWVRSSKSRRNKVKLDRCTSKGTDFKIEELNRKLPLYKKAAKAVKKFVRSLFGSSKSHEGWDSESGSSSEDNIEPKDTPAEKNNEYDTKSNDKKLQDYKKKEDKKPPVRKEPSQYEAPVPCVPRANEVDTNCVPAVCPNFTVNPIYRKPSVICMSPIVAVPRVSA